MNILSIIDKKKNNEILTQEEINYFVQGYTNDEIPDYQMSSLLMAIRINGMSDDETFYLTEAMINSGEVIDLSEIEGFKVDKHSTGGVGDKVTLVVTPILASLGIPVAKFSGRGLGITGGTLDKLESIRGFNFELTREQFVDNVKKHNIAIAGQTGNIVPADKKLYALRDVTGTVDSIPLIASSIMSKKIASGADGIVLDVKYGLGAFMKTKKDAKVLAEKMKAIGENFNRKIDYVLSDMNNPLGKYIGNKVEVVEAYEVLSLRMRNSSEDLLEECVTVAVKMHQLATGLSERTSLELVGNAISSGVAKLKLIEMIESQGGDIKDINIKDTDYVVEVVSDTSGIVEVISALKVGEVAVTLGAGRLTKDAKLDYDAGIELVVKHGEEVKSGDVIARLYSNREITSDSINKIKVAYEIV